MLKSELDAMEEVFINLEKNVNGISDDGEIEKDFNQQELQNLLLVNIGIALLHIADKIESQTMVIEEGMVDIEEKLEDVAEATANH